MAPHDGDRQSRGQLCREVALAALFGVVVAAAIVAPFARRGWLLLLDWAPGPRAVNGAFPAGPVFSVPVSGAHALFGAAVGWLPIACGLVVATAGAAVLVGGPTPARAAAGLAFAWNPFVFDRIAAGQVAFLAGYALLPWLTRAAIRADGPRAALGVGLWWAAASCCSVHFVWIGGVVVLAAAAVRARTVPTRRVVAIVASTFAVVLVAAGLWLTVVRPHAAPVVATDLTTFRTVSDPDLGRSLGILAQQGFWRPVVTRPRDDLGFAFPFVACAVIGAAAGGLVLARRTRTGRLAGTVAIAAGVGWVLAHGAAGPLGWGYRLAILHAPGFAVMREAQKWVALVSLATAVGLGGLATALARRTRAGAWCVALLPIALAPTLAWGLAGRIEPSRYPASWTRVRVALDGVPGRVVAVPWVHYTRAGITGERVVANVAPQYFGARVLVSDDGADRGLQARVRSAITAARGATISNRPVRLGPELAALGVRGVLVIGPDNDVPIKVDPTLALVAAGSGVELWVVRTSG